MKKPAHYYHVTSEPGRDFVGTLSRDEIRRLLAAGALQASCHATEEDGRSFVQLQQHGGPGRWRTLAELLAEWGEPLPAAAAAAALPPPWYVTPCAALAGAAACLLLAAFSLGMGHVAAALFESAGASNSMTAYFSSRESLLFDLIVATIAATFGAIRGVSHAGSMTRGETFQTIAGKAVTDLGNLRSPNTTFEHQVALIACLLFAGVLSLPVIVLLLVLWFR